VRTFEGQYLKCGSKVERSDLRPDPSYPENPVLLEFAGNDRTGRGHNRSNSIYILWRLTSRGWEEVGRALAQGADWVPQIRFLALRELGGPPPADPLLASQTARQLVCRLDAELRSLSASERQIALGLVYEQIAARIVESVPENSHILSQ
jgi:hypothetical protein